MCKSYCWSGSRCSIGQPLLLTQTSWVLPPLSVGKMTLRLYGALNYSHGLSKGPSFGTGRGLHRGEDQFAGPPTHGCLPVDTRSSFLRITADLVGWPVAGHLGPDRRGSSDVPWCINTGKSLIPLTLLFLAQKRNLLIPLELSRVMHQGSLESTPGLIRDITRSCGSPN